MIAPADADTADAEEDEIKEDEEVKDEDEGQKETQDCRCYKFFGICFLLCVAGLCFLCVYCFQSLLEDFWVYVLDFLFLHHNANRPSNLQVLDLTKMGLQTCGRLKSQRRNRDPSEYEYGLMKDIHLTSAEENLGFGGLKKT